MKLVLFFMLLVNQVFSQSSLSRPLSFKGEHYALYSKCWQAITFCEITQQTYTSCGSVKNCYGLYVLPGDTFYINIEDKTQSQVISADISFSGYFSPISGFIFKPIDANCIPEQALLIAIPLTAVPGSSFQIENQNISYVNSALSPGIPQPFNIYVGGQQPQFTFALSDFTGCPVVDDVGINIDQTYPNHVIYPNPTNANLNITDEQNELQLAVVEITNALGQIILSVPFAKELNVSHLPQGMYMLFIHYKDYKNAFKIIKQ
jgi:hypothetical protein